MSILSNILAKQGGSLVEALRESYAKNKVNASGRLSKTTEAKVTETANITRLEVVINKYGTLLESGRGPSRKRGGNLFAAIRRWVDDKGIIPKDGNKDSLAWAITKKIHKQGTRAFPNKGPKVLSSVVTEQRVNKIVNDVEQGAEAEIITELDKIIRLRYASNN